MLNSRYFLLIFVNFVCVVLASDPPRVRTKLGDLQGIFMTNKSGRKFNAFLGIPFAKPPLGELRFQPPQVAEKWEELKQATKVHAVCPQRDTFRRSNITEGEEDCLYLNVYTPKITTEEDELLAVMVFFHGGGFLCGSGNTHWYGPDVLLDRDVVLVVPNYRLGALGFLSTDDGTVSGNNGLKDQNLALRWIQENIRSFGGNPQSVTLFGESAGGASVHYHMLSKQSRGLFHRGISQSGTAFCLWTYSTKNENVQISKKLAESVGCPTSTGKEMVECLRKIDPITLVKQDVVYMEWDIDPYMPFRPTIEDESENAFITEHPVDIVKKGDFSKVPWILGINTHEGLLRAAGIHGNPHLLVELKTDFDNKTPITLLFKDTAVDPLSTSRKIREFYFGKEKLAFKSALDLVDMYTDGFFFSCIDQAILAHLLVSEQPIYFYHFDHEGSSSLSQMFGYPEKTLGVCHADELLYLFPISDSLFPNIPPTKNDKEVSSLLTHLWTNFAKHGSPNNDTEDIWKPIQNNDNMEYLYIHTSHCEMRNGLFSSRAKFWRTLDIHPKLKHVKDEL